jgi:hypothetical protein
MIFKLIRPKSLDDAAYEPFEFLIGWLGRDGSDYQYMFYDAEFERRVASEVINEQDSTRLQALISKVGRAVTLQADDLSLNDFEIISQILENNYVARIFKDGSFERYAPDANSFKYRQMDGRYELEFKLVLSDLKAWK